MSAIREPRGPVGSRPAAGVRLIALLACLVAALSAVAPAAAESVYPLTVVDDAGNAVILASPPRRVVSMVPSLTEAVCAIQACERLVGVDDYSDYPPQALAAVPRLGGLYDPNVERIVALAPDLVLLSRYGPLPQALSQAGVRAFVFDSETLEDVFRNVSALGVLLDRRGEASELVQRLRAELDRIASIAQGAGPAPTVYFEIDPTPYAAGPGSFIGRLLELAGGRNVVPAELGLFPRVSPELVITADPDVIILGDAPYGVTARDLAARPGWTGLRAVAAGRVVELTQAQVDVVSRPGPRVAEALRLLAAILHPELRDALGQP